MEQATAWVLQFSNGLNAAIGEREMIQIIDKPVLSPLKNTHTFCQQQIHWQGIELPVTDFRDWFTESDAVRKTNDYVVIVAYPREEGEKIGYAGIVIEAIPFRQQVKNNQVCTLPEPEQKWQPISISCFSYEGRATPILNLIALFSSVDTQSTASSTDT